MKSFEFEVGGNMKEIDLAWLAGIIDGEGSIFVVKQKRKDRMRDTNYILKVTVQSVDPYMAVECHKIAKQGSCFLNKETRENMSNTMKWQICGRKASELLKELIPFLRVKKHQAELAIQFQDTTKRHWKHMQVKDYEEQAMLYQKLKDAKLELKIGRGSNGP
jgi:hypothetical protein